MCPSIHFPGHWGRKRTSYQPSELDQCHWCGTLISEQVDLEIMDWLQKLHLWDSFLQLSRTSLFPYIKTQLTTIKPEIYWRSGTWFVQCSLSHTSFGLHCSYIQLSLQLFLLCLLTRCSSKAYHSQYFSSQFHKGTMQLWKVLDEFWRKSTYSLNKKKF